MLNIREKCNFCSSQSNSCSCCNLTGIFTRWTLSPPTNVFYSHAILEELDTTEYSALTGAQRAGIDTLLMCGLVDLNDGKVGRVRLWDWFGAESTTVANLTALLE